MIELWKPIEGYEKYLVSNLGRIQNSKTGKILKQTVIKTGYYTVVVKPHGRQGGG